MSSAVRIESVRTAPASTGWGRISRIAGTLLGFLRRKDRVPEKGAAERGRPSPRELEKFRRDLELKIARIQFYARLPL